MPLYLNDTDLTKTNVIVRVLLLLSFLFLSSQNTLIAQELGYFTLNDTLILNTELMYQEEFNDLVNWKTEQQPGGKVILNDGKMEVVDKAGCTVWFKKRLHQPLMIEFTATVIDEGGPHDRVSDLNCFWLATDPLRQDFFEETISHRNGKFNQYDSLKLYYVGLGGHNNTKTRFRRYTGNGEKPLLPSHDLSNAEFLITPNELNRIRIIVFNSNIQYWRNELLIFNVYDDEPLTSGYFAFRTVDNHLVIDDFKVYNLSEKHE